MGEQVILFTSDTHFGHANIVRYCNRPFADVDEMNAELVKRWNYRVQPEDTVYHLGDFAMGPRGNIPKFRAQLRGRIVLILGNHDRSASAMLSSGFDEVHTSLSIVVDGVSLFLRHTPPPNLTDGILDESRFFKPPEGPIDYQLCGHVHEAFTRKGNVINVGVDVREFKPRTLWEILQD